MMRSFWRKKHFSQEKTFATKEWNIFARINFRECYQIKYFAVPNFCEFAKKLRNCETLNAYYFQIFRALRKDFYYRKCCDQWGQKNWVFQISGRLNWTMVPVPCIHTNISNCFWLDYSSWCPSMLIDILLNEACQYVITVTLQSDPIERRFSQYRQMSGGRFLVSLREVLNSERILRCRSLIKENLTFGKRILHLKIRTVLS